MLFDIFLLYFDRKKLEKNDLKCCHFLLSKLASGYVLNNRKNQLYNDIEQRRKMKKS